MNTLTIAGATWDVVTASTAATGTYAWVIPNTPSSTVKIRLTDLTDPTCKTDTSNGSFIITSTVSVLQPNGGEVLQAVVGAQGSTVIMNNAPEKLNTASFYDDGGLVNNYSNTSYTKTFKPDFPTNKLKVTFQSYSFETGDILYVYDGTTTAAPLLATLTGTNSSNVSYQATNSTGALTFKYQSDGDANVASGWDALITSVGTNTANVTWNIVGTSKYFDLEYSINAGATWTRIISHYYSTTGTYAWQVPNTPTTQGRLRVIDAGNNIIKDTSNANFTILAAPPFFLLNTPNGGESLYPSSNSDITWASAFAGLNVALEYSINNGSTWNSIISSTPNISETYSWLVPNTPSTQCLVRVKDAANASANDVSNAVFTIKPFITVTAPNGGTSGARCSAYNITWDAGGTSGTYKLDYSTDGGATWNLIVNNLTTGCTGNSCSYAWTLPNALTTQLKVRVSDVADLTKLDVSDANMSVVLPPSPVQLLSPNGSEVWVTGTTQNITYSYGSGTTTVSLDYSIDNGRTWTNIIANTTANGSYAWVVPNVPSDSVFVRVTGDQYNGCDYDLSDLKFKIASSVQVTQPNGGESWQATVGLQGTTINMSNATVVLNTANYYDNGGIASNYTGTDYTQTLVPDNPLNKLKINVTEWQLGSRYGYSYNGQEAHLYVYDGPTTSSPLVGDLSISGTNYVYQSTHSSGSLTIKIVNSGYTGSGWKGYITSVGTTTKDIKWNIIGTSKRFDIDYSTNGGTAWTRVVSDLPNTTGVYAWQVPNTPTTQARVRVRDAGNNVIVDSSDANFTITAATPFFIVQSPNGGERWYPGQTKTITWSAPSFNISTVKIEYTMNGGTTWNEITSSTQNSGTYSWIVPNVSVPMPNCKVRISKSDEPYYYDISDNVFEIRPGIVITSPNGNSSLFQSCTQSSITWQGDASTNCSIELSLDSGQTWSAINSNYAVTSFNNNYSWTIPNSPSANCLVRVTDLNNSSYVDKSDSVFTIQPSIVINYPSYGGIFQSGTTIPISWTSNLTSNYYNIDYSLDNGTTWTAITTNQLITTNTYNWVVPAISSTNVRIRVTDYAASCKSAQSSVPFTLVSGTPPLTLTSANSGTYNSCSALNLTWTAAASVTSVNLLYSKDAGRNWILIGTNINATPASYSWILPNIGTTQALVKIVDASNPSNYDVSNNVFTINQTLSVSVTSSVSPTICSGDTVRLSSSLATGNIWSSGATTQSISVVSSGSYYLTNTQSGCTATSNVINVIVNPKPSTPIVTANGSTTFCETGSVVLQTNTSAGITWLPGGLTTQSILVTTSGNYAVSITNQFGCTTTSTPISVNVIASGTPPQATSNSPILVNSNLQLYASSINNATYLWNGPNGYSSQLQNPIISNIQANMSGVYTVSATISGCQTPFSSTTVNVINNSRVKVAGYFLTPNGDSIPFVKANLIGSSTTDTISTQKGRYEIYGSAGGQYTLAPSKNNDIVKSNGVSTLDIIKIQSHILHIDSLNSPYKIIAADVNGSGTVTNLDILYIRRLILGIDTTFPGNKLWSFVDANYNFLNSYNPFPYKSIKSYNSFAALDTQNFIGVKLGDVTYDWNKSILKHTYHSPVELYADTVKVDGGDTIHLFIRAKSFNAITGMQFTMGWNSANLEFINVGNNPYNIQFGRNNSSKGVISVLWNEPTNKGVTINTGDVFFELIFKKTNDFRYENLSLNSTVTPIESYDDGLNYHDIVFTGGVFYSNNKIDITQQEGIKVYPNPNNGIAFIDFPSQYGEDFNLAIINHFGEIIGETKIDNINNKRKISLNLNKQFGILRNGVYFIRIYNKKVNASFKILFQH